MNLSTLALTVLLSTQTPAPVGQPVVATAPDVAAPQTNPGVPSQAIYRIGLEDEIRLNVDGEDQFNTEFNQVTDRNRDFNLCHQFLTILVSMLILFPNQSRQS